MSELPTWLRPHTDDRRFAGDEPIGDCLCSRCLQPIGDREIPIWFWTDNHKWAWRYHDKCLGIEAFDVDDDWADWDEDEEVEAETVAEETPDYGPCCACHCEDGTVRNFLMLPRRASVAGTGWGCVICGLPEDGAVAVVCDDCLEAEAEIVDVIHGYAQEKYRIPKKQLVDEVFEHDMSRHEGEA